MPFLLIPTAMAAFMFVAIVSSVASGGGRELLHREHAVIYPVSPTTDHLGALLLAPLNLGWLLQAWILLRVTAFGVGRHGLVRRRWLVRLDARRHRGRTDRRLDRGGDPPHPPRRHDRALLGLGAGPRRGAAPGRPQRGRTPRSLHALWLIAGSSTRSDTSLGSSGSWRCSSSPSRSAPYPPTSPLGAHRGTSCGSSPGSTWRAVCLARHWASWCAPTGARYGERSHAPRPRVLASARRRRARRRTSVAHRADPARSGAWGGALLFGVNAWCLDGRGISGGRACRSTPRGLRRPGVGPDRVPAGLSSCRWCWPSCAPACR